MNMPHRLRFAPAALALLLGFSACSAPVASGNIPTSQALAVSPDSLVQLLIAGEYKGSITDSAKGKGKAVLQFAQGVTSAGGSLKQTYGSKTFNGVVSFGRSGPSMNGNEVLLGSSPCTFVMTAKYNPKTVVLNGSYNAISGCKGRSGTFKVTEQCYYVTPTASADIERPSTVSVRPC
jgi:hypothetical protein